MLIFITILGNFINVCISENSTESTDCKSWYPNNETIRILNNSTDFSDLDIKPNTTINLGIGSVPDLSIDLSTLVTETDFSDNVNLIISVTQPSVNNIITFDFTTTQFDDLSYLTFNNLQLKPKNNTMVHTTSTTHSYHLIFNDVVFLSGYAFDSDVFIPLARFDFEDIAIVELRDRWENDKEYKHYSVFGNFFFNDGLTYAYEIYNDTNNNYITFINDNFHGKITIVTEYVNKINFIMNETTENPILSFDIYSGTNNFYFSGGWNENVTVINEGIQAVYNGSDKIYIFCNSDEDSHLPISVTFGKNELFRSNYDISTTMSLKSDVREFIIKAGAETITFLAPWNISSETKFTRNSKSDAIIFEQINFINESAAIYRTDVQRKMFHTNGLTIMDGLTFTYPGKTDINIVGDINIRPGVNLSVDSKMRFDKNKATLKLLWNPESGFPYLNILDPDIITGKGIPNIVFTDEEPESNIADANETYGEFLRVPIKIICGLGITEIEPSKFRFFSPNPSFSENGVWEYFWALDDNGQPTGTDNLTQNLCLWVNMTDLPEVPVIPLPTPTKDPAAVEKKAMIAMIVVFCLLLISGILGYFTKFLKQNKRDREKEKQDELNKLNNARDLSDSTSNFDDSEVTQGMNESDLSDHAVSFVHDLSISSDDDFSTTLNATTNANQAVQSNTLSRKNTTQVDSLSSANEVEKATTKKKKRTRGSTAKSKRNDDVDTPLLNSNDD